MDLTQLQGWLTNLDRGVQAANTQARRAVDAFTQARQESEQLRNITQQQSQQLQHLQGLMQGMSVGGSRGGGRGTEVGRPDMLTIEEIPGRRIPYDMTIQIGIPDSQTSPITGTWPLSMDGPFIAVARYATFISSYTFQVTNSENTERYTGRTWGRQRPIASTLDLMDAVTGWADGLGTECSSDCSGEGSGPVPAIVSRPTSRSPGRSMVFDGYVQVKSSVYPRQNQQVPTSLWAPGFNQMLQLPVLDYWEKGDTIEVEIEPLHQNNPAGGNIQALAGSMPYLQGQFDGQEGISYPAWQCTPGQSDVIARRPSGVLVVGFLGYKILQPPGVRMR